MRRAVSDGGLFEVAVGFELAGLGRRWLSLAAMGGPGGRIGDHQGGPEVGRPNQGESNV